MTETETETETVAYGVCGTKKSAHKGKTNNVRIAKSYECLHSHLLYSYFILFNNSLWRMPFAIIRTEHEQFSIS